MRKRKTKKYVKIGTYEKMQTSAKGNGIGLRRNGHLSIKKEEVSIDYSNKESEEQTNNEQLDTLHCKDRKRFMNFRK